VLPEAQHPDAHLAPAAHRRRVHRHGPARECPALAPHVLLFAWREARPEQHEAVGEDFKRSLSSAAPPAVAPALVALWHDAKGNWDLAHSVAQDVDDGSGAWVHAYLHRKEGDEGNAGYWYRRAGRSHFRGSLDEEWDQIVETLLGS
jgi:hypothetical protein